MADKDEHQWIRTELTRHGTMLDRIDAAVRGNGKDGLVTRVSKLEWAAKLLFWLGGAMAIPVIAMAVKTAYEHFGKH